MTATAWDRFIEGRPDRWGSAGCGAWSIHRWAEAVILAAETQGGRVRR